MKAKSKVQIENEFRRCLLTGAGAALLVGALDGCGVGSLAPPHATPAASRYGAST